MKKSLVLICIILLAVSGLFAQEWDHAIKIVSSDRAANDHFGYSVAISGNFAIVGARFEDQNSSGTDSLSKAGAAYIFSKSGDTWIQEQKLVASDRTGDDLFGMSVAISGNYAIIGAYQQNENASGTNTLINAGAAYIFYNNGATWTQQQKIDASDRGTSDYFACSVAISGDNIIVGAYDEDEDTSGTNTLLTSGSAYIFERAVSTWNQKQKIVASNRAESNWFGYSVAISGNDAIVGAYRKLGNIGSAYIFERETTGWVQQQEIIAPAREGFDYFGHSVAISGDNAIVGAYEENEDENEENTLPAAGSAYIFTQNSDDTTKINNLTIPAEFGLQKIYPNPFNPRTAISYRLSAVSFVNINIYNTNGALVKELLNVIMKAVCYE